MNPTSLSKTGHAADPAEFLRHRISSHRFHKAAREGANL
jgi:hypothetical protein